MNPDAEVAIDSQAQGETRSAELTTKPSAAKL
jgi:hypothetical protein